MKLQAKQRLRALAVTDWQDSVRATYGEQVRFKRVDDLVRAFLGRTQIAEYKDGSGSISQGASLLSDAISEPGVTDINLPTSTGVVFETLIDGDPSQHKPMVQEVTNDDGGIEPPDEQQLLIDDISSPDNR